MGLFDISLKDLSKVVFKKALFCFILSPEISLDLGAYAKGTLSK